MPYAVVGITAAMVTALTDNGGIDEIGMRRLVNHLISGGVHGLLVAGSQGEFYGLSREEKRQIMEIVVDETRGRVPVHAGTGAESTREVLQLTRMAQDAGADAISVITPYYISPSDNELYEHYAAVAQVTQLPVLLYNNPARTGVKLSVEVVSRLAEIENIVGIKDSSGDLTLTTEYIRQTNPGFSVLVGRDTLIYAGLLSGASGAIAACANVAPQLTVEIYEAYVNGDLNRALEAQRRLTPLRLAFDMGTFPVVIKEALALMGICSRRAMSPVGSLLDTQRTELKKVLQELRVL